MLFKDAIKAAAYAADNAVSETMLDYKNGLITDEDDITGYLLGNLRNSFNGIVGGLTWTSSILRHRAGKAAQEKRIGADMLIHVSLNTPTQTYSKGVLVQAKRVEPFTNMNKQDHTDLLNQCKKMLAVTPSAFVFDYAQGTMRCGSAMKVAGATSRDLYSVCDWTSYRFFRELFICSIGDSAIQSALVENLSVPTGINITGSGQLTSGSP